MVTQRRHTGVELDELVDLASEFVFEELDSMTSSDSRVKLGDWVMTEMGIEAWQLDDDVDGAERLQEEYYARLSALWQLILVETMKRTISFYGHPTLRNHPSSDDFKPRRP